MCVSSSTDLVFMFDNLSQVIVSIGSLSQVATLIKSLYQMQPIILAGGPTLILTGNSRLLVIAIAET